MSIEDIYKSEVERRRQAIVNLKLSLIDTNAALEQFNDLDETYKTTQKEFEDKLNCIYKETRHYTGEWPLVYNFSKSDRYPYFAGATDDDCNPYYRISLVEAGQDEGISPLDSPPNRTGGAAINRYRAYANETPLRSAALTALQAYPDRTFEGAGASGGSCSDPLYTNQTSCLLAMETWTQDYESNTAVDLLLNALNPWKAEIADLKTDLCNSELDSSTAATLLQDILDEIAIIEAELPPAPTYPNLTPNSGTCSNPLYTDEATCTLNGGIWDQPLQDAIDATAAYIQTDMPTDIDSRKAPLASKASTNEKKFFGIIGLRLHQINGSYSKIQQLKDQKRTNEGLVADHIKSVANINVLRVKES